MDKDMGFLLGYDSTNPKSLEEYAQKLIGHTFNEVNEWNLVSYIKDVTRYEEKARKGGLGNFIEECYFGYKANSDSEADFSDAGVELKVTPYEIKKEEIYRNTYRTFEEANMAIFKYIEGWYNRKRLHSSINYMTPDQCELLARSAA